MRFESRNKAKLLALGALVLVAAYGCTSGDDSSDDPANGEDQLILEHGAMDQAGIVESSTMMLAGGPTDGHLDSYNREDPFKIAPGNYADTFKQRLAQFDNIDQTTDWKPEQAAAWAARMSTGNYLVVDTSKPCNFADPHTYLEIERAQLTGKEHETCGGRIPNEDALDVTLNFLARGPAASVSDEKALHDGVDQATQKSSDTFPYLAEYNGL
jgi:hypothetical protein